MTKAKARLRAKAKAVEKVRKRKANAGQEEPKKRAGQFDPGSGSISSPRAANAKTTGAMRRGAARSR